MMGNPWSKFFWSDWRAEPTLRICSLAARGLWMDMLAIMHEAQPRGCLVVAGKPLTAAQLASLVGSTADEVGALLEELGAAEVFSRKRNGVIYSRRMEKEVCKSAKARLNGGLGGNPVLINAGDKSEINQSNSRDKSEINRGSDRVSDAQEELTSDGKHKEKDASLNQRDNLQLNPEVNTQKPEARSQKPEARKKGVAEEGHGSAPRVPPPPQPPIDFDLWEKALFAVEGVKGTSLEISPYSAMVRLKLEGFDLHSEVLPFLKADLAKARQHRRLNKLSWGTIAQRVREARTHETRQSTPSITETDETWANRLAFARTNQVWDGPKWGPWPHQPGCRVPSEKLLPTDGRGWVQWKAAG